jgi:riboflavin kinase/FMN adenylyltransferase
MRIVQGLESYPPEARPAVVALGVFDGLHLGHREILAAAVRRAREGGLVAVACTFEPHPMEVLQPGRAPAPIATLAERLDLIEATGVDTTVVLMFTRDLAAVEPEAFVKDVVLDRLRACEIVVGFNHTFGRGARGNARLLEALATRLGFRVEVVPPRIVDGIPVSSSEIREALRLGDVERAARYLGRPYAIGGTVEAGAGRGRTLGFPTANVRPDRPLLIATGVYGGGVEVAGGRHRAVVNVGVRPTFGEDRLVVEAHLLDFAGTLYDRPVRLAFLARLREERKFPDVEALRRQISQDVEAARKRLGEVNFT